MVSLVSNDGGWSIFEIGEELFDGVFGFLQTFFDFVLGGAPAGGDLVVPGGHAGPQPGGFGAEFFGLGVQLGASFGGGFFGSCFEFFNFGVELVQPFDENHFRLGGFFFYGSGGTIGRFLDGFRAGFGGLVTFRLAA